MNRRLRVGEVGNISKQTVLAAQKSEKYEKEELSKLQKLVAERFSCLLEPFVGLHQLFTQSVSAKVKKTVEKQPDLKNAEEYFDRAAAHKKNANL